MAEWYKAVETVTPHVVRILTPRGSGTGFFFYRKKRANGGTCQLVRRSTGVMCESSWTPSDRHHAEYRRPDHGPLLGAPSRVQHRAHDAIDTEPGMPSSTKGARGSIQRSVS